MATPSREIIFLGQKLTAGSCAFFSTSNAAVFAQSTAFSVIQYFEENGGFDDNGRMDAFYDSDGNCILGLAYKKNPNNAHECNTYIFPVSVGDYPDPDGWQMPNGLYPNYASERWFRLSNWDGSYSGFDPDNYTLEDVARNQFSLYLFETELCPFWGRYGNNSMSAEDVSTSGWSTVIVTQMTNNSTGEYGFTNPSEIVMMDLGLTPGWINWIPPGYSDPAADQYNLSTIHWGNMCNVLNIAGVTGDVDKFTDDVAGTTGVKGGFLPYDGSVWFHDLPQHSFADIGLITLYTPTESQLRDLGNYLWTTDFVTNIKKLINDPLDNIISLGYVPIDTSSVKDSMTRELYVGNMGTGVQMFGLTTQYIPVNMGTVKVPERWGGALDYDPYSHCEMFIPFCGFVQIPIAEIMDSYVTLYYYVDLFSGDCIAEVGADRRDGRRVVIASHKGNCKINCALTGKNYGEFYANLMSSAPRAVGNFGVNMAQGNILGAGTGLIADASQVASSSPRVERSGAYTGAGSILAGYTPYIIFTQPIQQYPENYSKYVGYPSYVTRTLTEVSKAGGGFTMVAEVIDNTVPATDTEKKMIEDLLKEGVILPDERN